MYEVDSEDRAVPLEGVPQHDVGSSGPALIAADGRLELAYAVQRAAPDSVGALDDGSIARLTFVRPYAHTFGPPNDEALEGHPLADRGLGPYGCYLVEHSSWIRGLGKMNSMHVHHDPRRYERLRHYILTFHDSTFECVAHDLSVEIVAAAQPLNLAINVSL